MTEQQHPIDLMPASIRAKNQAGVRTNRFIAASAAVLVVSAVVATHSRWHVANAHAQLDAARMHAANVFVIESRAKETRDALIATQAAIDLYEEVAFPVPVSGVMATVINALPESVTLDQFDLDAGARVLTRTARSKGDSKTESTQRTLRGEISGFAASDEHIAQLVSRLENTPPFKQVNLDFSRTKTVHDHDAREFRLSFRIDLGVQYAIQFADDLDESRVATAEEDADAN